MIIETYKQEILDLSHGRAYAQGYVVNNADPLRKSRVKVKIDGISDQIDEDLLPWYPVIQGQQNSYTDIPPNGARVIVRYFDIYNSVVLGAIPSLVK